jgi:hypothetical protein
MLVALLRCALALSLPESTAVDTSQAFQDLTIFEELLGESGGDELADELDWRSEHPLDLNRASAYRLLTIPGVCEEDAEAIALYRKRNGPFVSVAQLGTIPGGSSRLYRLLSPYVSLRRERGSPLTLRSRALFRRRTGGAGTLPGTWTRLTLRPGGGIELGGTFEKGESAHDASGGGYGIVRSSGGTWEIIVGDFSFRGAQGLVVWNGGMNGKSAMAATTPGKPGGAFLPHRTGASNRFFRGGGVALEFLALGGRWRASGFASRRLLPVRVTAEGTATSILDPAEATEGSPTIARMTVRVGGGRLEYTPDERLFLGCTFFKSAFDRLLLRDDPLRLSGRGYGVGGIDLRLHTGGSTLLAEGAVTDRGDLAWIAVLRHSFLPSLSLLLVHRSYDPRFDNMMAGGFGEWGETRNERGTYAGFSFSPHPALMLRGYVDIFRRPAPGGTLPFATHGEEYLISAEFRFSRSATLRMRATERISGGRLSASDPVGRDIVIPSPERKRRLLAGLDFTPERGWEFQTRLEWIRALRPGGPPSHSLGISHALRGRIGSRCHFEVRGMVFSSESYDARLFPIESDLPGVFGSQTLFGRGSRWFCLLSLDPAPLFSLSVKLAVTEKEEDVITEGRPVVVPASGEVRAGVQAELRL